MGMRGRETQDTGSQDWHLLPPPERRVLRRTASIGEGGGGRSGHLQGQGDRTEGLQGGTLSGTHGGAGSSGGHGGSGNSGGHGGSASEAATPAPTSTAGAILPPSPKNT